MLFSLGRQFPKKKIGWEIIIEKLAEKGKLKNMMVFWLIFSFLLGLAVGSFLNCLNWRLFNKKSLLGRSVCPKCGHQLSWLDNIPVVSFILLKGRCRYCGEKISWEYPVVEIITGFLFSLVFLKYAGYLESFNIIKNYLPGLEITIFNQGTNVLIWQIIRGWIGVFTLLFVFIYDLKYQIIEDVVLLPAAGAVFLINLFLGWPWQGMLLGIFMAILFFGLQYVLTKFQGIGLGDMRIGIFLAALFAHWPTFLLVLFLGYIIGAVVSLLLILFKKKKWSSKVPLGPFLSLAALIVLFLA